MNSNNSDQTLIDTVIIGGGHAGLCMSYALQQGNREHVVLEKGKALEQWRSCRWDSFMMNTPQAYHRMLGQKDNLPDDQMSLAIEETIRVWDEHIKANNFPVLEHTEVISVQQYEDDNFIVSVRGEGDGSGSYLARNVIAAPGNYQLANIPDYASHLSRDIQQLRVGTYTNPGAIRDGAILVIGCGQTGVQIGEELLDAGRKVFIATSHVKGTLRSYRGEDIFFPNYHYG